MTQEQETAMYDQRTNEDDFNVNLCGACRNPDLPDLIDVTHCEWCGVRI